MKNQWKTILLGALFFALLGVPSARAAGDNVTVFAAASTTNALTEIAKLYEAGSGVKVGLSFASSSTLAKQIESGAPADVFLSANAAWMNYLEEKHVLALGSRSELLGNRIVFIVPASSGVTSLAVSPQLNLAALLGKDGRLSVGDPVHVPVGMYAKAALTQFRLWEQVAGKIAPAKDVRAGLVLVERAESPLGIVYASDASISNKVRIVGVFPADSHPPVDYPVAAVKNSNTEAALRFIDFLRHAQAQALWAQYGFEVK